MTNAREFDADIDSQQDGWAMSKEEIEACTDTTLLHNEGFRYEERDIIIRTMLQFPDQHHDASWFIRARGALIIYRLAAARVSRRIKQLAREKYQREKAASISLTPEMAQHLQNMREHPMVIVNDGRK